MARKTIDFLPEIFKSETNKKFLGATFDQLISEPNLTRINGFIGRKFSPVFATGKNYIVEPTNDRQNYQFEPAVVVKKNNSLELYSDYKDLIDKIGYYGGITDNHDRLFKSDYYSFNPRIDLDKFINFTRYYWLPNGPDIIDISGSQDTQLTTFNFTRITNSYSSDQHLGNNPEITLVRGTTYNFVVNQAGNPFWIQTEPGFDGLKDYNQNVSSRLILGVDNNGDDIGTISFAVPERDAQDQYIKMPLLYFVDYAIGQSFSSLDGDFWNNIASIDNDPSFPHLRYAVFLDDPSIDSDWVTYDGTFVPVNKRKGLWQITINDQGRVRFAHVRDIIENNRIRINRGDVHAGYKFYKDAQGELVSIDPITAPLSVLYYQDGSNPDIVGKINLVDSLKDSIDVETDILGKLNYTSPTGVVFTNSLKIRFDNSVTPIGYQGKTYIIEGVGVGIKLVDFEKLNAVESDAPETTIPWDSTPFDSTNFDEPVFGTAFVDYIVMNRSSIDGNAWARTNRWFHEDIITKTAEYNKSTANINQSLRAQRPIVEFEADLQLFNHGRILLDVINRVDMIIYNDENPNSWIPITDAFAQINNKSITDTLLSYMRFQENQTILFPNDLDFSVRSKIYQLTFKDQSNTTIFDSNGTGSITSVIGQTRVVNTDPLVSTTSFRTEITVGSIIYTAAGSYIGKVRSILTDGELLLENPATVNYIGTFKFNQPRIELIPITTADTFDSVVVRSSLNIKKSYWFDGDRWQLAQLKTVVNQPPLFDIIDQSDHSFSDRLYYGQSDFSGSKVFSYKIGSGIIDQTLGFRLTYNGIGSSIADITFVNNFDTDTFTYYPEAIETKEVSTGFIRKNFNRYDYDRLTVWEKVSQQSKQYQHIIAEFDGITNYFEIDILPNQETNEPNIKVFVNNKLIDRNKYTLQTVGIRKAVRIEYQLVGQDKIDILIYSDQISEAGYYQIPKNLEFNALNVPVDNVTLGQIRGHWAEIGRNTIGVVGDVLSTNNLRDLDTRYQPGTILQHSAPTIYSSLFLIDPLVNFANGIELAKRDYTKFKNKFLELCLTISGLDPNNPTDGVEVILRQINEVKNATFAWHHSDMVPWTQNFITDTHFIIDVQNKIYQIPNIYNATGDEIYPDSGSTNKAILVYLNNQLLIKDQDYFLVSGTPAVVLTNDVNLTVDDILEVRGYTNTEGSYVPETPTKLGLYPKFKPGVLIDDTYRNNIQVIQGHDGSLTPRFDDLRDNYLLELENRIYNNLKTEYNPDLMDIMSVKPGKFRNTDYTITEFNQVLNGEFLKWVGKNQIDYSTNDYFQPNDGFTWNYNQTFDNVNSEALLGYWRGIYKYFFDTDRPHSHPWQMLGIVEKPDWWDLTYGPAPYPSTYSQMWADIEGGFVRGTGTVRLQYVRPGLSNFIPVDIQGNLISPNEILIKGFDGTRFTQSYSIGDHGPVETAWSRSSEYPYAIQRAMALLRPAQYFGLLFDTTLYAKDLQTESYTIVGSNSRVSPSRIKINGETVNGITSRALSYINWIHGYLTNLGLDAASKIRNTLDNLDVKLGYKVAGFTDKKYLTTLVEQFSPTSSNESVIIPDENYIVYLNKSVPIRRATYSAVIIEKTISGYSISGYNLKYPYFTVVPSEFNGNSYTIESLSARAVIYRDYKTQRANVPYGFEFRTSQQIVDFLVGYQRYLTSQGFVFSDYDNDLKHTKDWVLSAREFLTWTVQGWKPGNVLVLSPIADKLKIFSEDSVIDAITNQTGESQLIGMNFNTIRLDEISVLRDTEVTTVSSTKGETISFADLNLVQYEHVLVFDNVTVFNDIVYKPELGSRQYRLKLIGNKTAEWAGALNPPGFIYNTGVIDDWQLEKDYKKADIVRYKNQNYTAISDIAGSSKFDFDDWSLLDNQIVSGLISNFANNAKKFEGFYDIEDTNTDEYFNNFSRGLIGYRSRSFLDNLGMDPTSQVKFYQGYIKEKGTKNAVQSLFGGDFNSQLNELSMFEEWGVRVGEYGALRSNQSIELILPDDQFKGNPSVFKLLNSGDISTDNIATIRPKELLNKPIGYRTPIFLDRPLSESYETDIITAGYVNVTDVNTRLFDFNSYRDLNEDVITNLNTGYTIWVAKDFNNEWQVYHVTETANSIRFIEYSLDNTIKITTEYEHGLRTNDVFAIRGFGESFDGFYKVLNVESTNTLITSTDIEILNSEIGEVFEGQGKLFDLQKCRYHTISDRDSDITKHPRAPNDLVWVDKNDTSVWSVYKFLNIALGNFSSSNSNWFINDGLITLRASGLPYHSHDESSSIDQKYNRIWRLHAGTNTSVDNPTKITTGLVGFWLNGVSAYSPIADGEFATDQYAKVSGLNYNLGFSDYGRINKDLSGGTTAQGSRYYYTGFTFGSVWATGTGVSGSQGLSEISMIGYLGGNLVHPTGHSKILGFSLDGYPIYGPYGYSDPLDPLSSISLMSSSYTLRNSSYRELTDACDLTKYPMGMFIQDFVFINSGDLDRHNGRFCVTPDYSNGTYAYFTTVDIQGNPVYPYIIGESYYGPITRAANPLSGGAGISPATFSSITSINWTLDNQQQSMVDIRSIGGFYLFDNKNKIILTRIDYIDPAKGRVLGSATADIDFMSSFDPAKYNQGTIEELPISIDYHWGEKQVGTTWWDLDVVRYYDYEQGSLQYRIDNWGKTFPGSLIHVYEWISTDVLPSEYVDSGQEGVPKYSNDGAYVTLPYVDGNTGIVRNKYCYWVRARTTVPSKAKSHSVLALESMIRDPILQNIPYAGVIRNNSIALFNIGSYISGNNTALHIDYKLIVNDAIVHSEYELFQEGNENDVLHPRVEGKLIDSIIGADIDNNLVPDPSLLPGDKIGISVKPRQTLIVNRLRALENIMTYVNDVLKQFPVSSRIINKDVIYSDNFYAFEKIPGDDQFDFVIETVDQLSFIPQQIAGALEEGKEYVIELVGTTDFTLIGASSNTVGTRFVADLTNGMASGTGYAFPSRILVEKDANYNNRWAIYLKNLGTVPGQLIKLQTYNTTNFWYTVDWYAPKYSSETILIDYIVNNFNDVYKLDLVDGNIIRVKDNGTRLFEIYKYLGDGKFELIAIQNGTIQIKSDLWSPVGFDRANYSMDPFDFNYFTELRYIINGIKEDIFVRDLAIYWNKLLFFVIEYILSEQKYVDWIFKTSFISISHRIGGLIQSSSFVKDRQSFYESYIKETKPYRTKIREYSLTYVANEPLDRSTVTDFDLPAYYDRDLKVYRSPNGYQPLKDQQLLDTRPEYQDWKNHHKFDLGSTEIAGKGRGFLTNPDISVISTDNTSTPANVRVLIDAIDGGISKSYVTNPGKDYITTPIIAISGTGTVPMSKWQSIDYKQPILSPRLINNKVRKIKTILKFDRIQYDSKVSDWSPAETYPIGSYVSYQGQGYISTALAEPSNSFDRSLFVEVGSDSFDNANDRINSFYRPTVDMIPRVLSRLMVGLDNPQADSTNQVVIDTAISGGGFSGAGIPAGQFEIGEEYIITELGDTDFTLIGATDNKVGVKFIATGAGSGTGSAAIALFTRDFGTVAGIAAEEITVVGGAFVSETFSHAPEELLPGITYDAVSIKVIDNNNLGYRRFVNMLAETMTTLFDPANNTVLAQPLKVDDTEIQVVNASILIVPNPIAVAPGVIYINGERIEYYSKVNNTLGQIRRGTGGTSTPMLHRIGSTVENLGYPGPLYN